MKIKNLFSTLAVTMAVFCGATARADGVRGGDIYSVDLVAGRGGSVIPSDTNPLTIGQRVAIRLRLINKGYDRAETVKIWEFKPTTSMTVDPKESPLPPQLGLMLGGQQVYAAFDGQEQAVAQGINKFTDLFFIYTVKSGDLALPARFMSTNGTAVSDENDSTDYAIKFCNWGGSYWQLANDDADTAVVHFCSEQTYPDTTFELGRPNRGAITGTGLGIHIKTVDFDKQYYTNPDPLAGKPGVWRLLYRTMTTALPAAPTVAVDGFADESATMYVWVDNTNVANVVSADEPEYVKTKDKDDGRWVIKVPIAKGASAATFRLQGVSEGTTVVRMSSSRELVYNGAGDLIKDWVERPIKVDPPPTPFVMVETLNRAGQPQTEFDCPADYENYVGMFRITLSQPPAAEVTVTLTPDDWDVIPEELEDRLIGLSLSSDPTTMPWEDRELSVKFTANDSSPKTIYVYALDQFDQKGGKVEFAPSVSGPGSAPYVGDPVSGALFVKATKPVLLSPAEGETLDPATLREDYTLFLRVENGYQTLRSDDWTIQYKGGPTGDTKIHEATGVEVVDEEAGEISADFTFAWTGADQELNLRVIDPNGNKTEWRKVKITVNEGKSIITKLDKEVYAESAKETAKASFSLSQPYGEDLYLFLDPLNEDARPENNRVSSSSLAVDGNSGIRVRAGHLEADGTAIISLLDGGYGSNYMPEFKVVACSKREYKSKYLVDDWEGGFVVQITNVEARITKVEVGGITVNDGGVLKTPIVMNVPKTFKVTVDEPGKTDRAGEGLDTFRVQWRFGDGAWEDMDGDPASKTLTKTFYTSGDYDVAVRCQDKDMRTEDIWSDEYTFRLNVLEKPQIAITPAEPGKTSYYEDETGSTKSSFYVTLSAPPKFTNGTDRLTVELIAETIGTPVPPSYTTDYFQLSKTTVSFDSGKTNSLPFNLKLLDGTTESASDGFRITARVQGGVKDDEGKEWDPGTIELQILNRPPTITSPAEKVDDEGKPISSMATIGTDNTLTWSVRDIAPDKRAMTVTFETSEGKRKTYRQGDPGFEESVFAGTHTWTFDQAGEKSIIMTVTDKDGDSESRTWYYVIEASKMLKVTPHGPSGGFATANSKRYRSAAGLGEGRVFAKNLSSMEEFVATFNCGVADTWSVYAYGYKVNDVDNGTDLHKVDGTLGYYTNRDIPVDENGDAWVADESATSPYAYAAPKDARGNPVDSFLYTFLQIGGGKSGGSQSGGSLTDELYGGTTQPEYSEVKGDVGIVVKLPGKGEGGGDSKAATSYEDTMLEAVFSREYLASDNMGDINQDGIPDIYVDKFQLVQGDGASSGDDLKAITVKNGGNADEDYLPRYKSSVYSPLIPGLPGSWADGTPFAAKTEIRGYGEALNDAPRQPWAWANVSGVKPDRVYTDPRTDPLSTLDGLDPNGSNEPVEYYAWLEYAASHGLDPANEANWDTWSPERPTDPTLDDSDDDGFTDGYEYFFWYRAHVGYMDNGVHRRLTGRAYDPKNPGQGKFISSETIERLMDPCTSSGDPSAAEDRDTDNDGLPDLLEFEIGTNPFDFDTDGDGLPDGFEIMLTGTSPLLFQTTKDLSDAMRNYDGDAMAYSSMLMETIVIPTPDKIATVCTWALIDPNGDSDGIQWYAEKTDEVPFEPATNDVTKGTLLLIGDEKYLTTAGGTLTVERKPGELTLAVDLPKDSTWRVRDVADFTNSFPSLVEIAETDPNATIRLMPTRLFAGQLLAEEPVADASAIPMKLAAARPNANAAWVYGSSEVSLATLSENPLAHIGDFGQLAIGRYKAASDKQYLASLPAEDPFAAYLHYLVYQEYGFDPRTAWNPNTPLGLRWGSTADLVEPGSAAPGTSTTPELLLNNYNAALGVSTRTREYTLYDEFLLLSFFINNGVMQAAEITPTDDNPWYKIWSRYTTNGQGPHEPLWDIDQADGQYKGRTAETNSGENGADTDMDGVPDGWELYVMTGPKGPDGKFIYLPPYGDASFLSPFEKRAGSQLTDNEAFNMDADGLTELMEYEGTDSCKYYSEPWAANLSPYSTTIALPENRVTPLWFNKFMPTDPWNPDTDGDGMGDDESGIFAYGTPIDDGSSCIPGGGGNPHTWDTDLDGLPDPWEAQFAGSKPYNGEDAEYQEGPNGEQGNTLQGLMDGMDGTVFDAYNSPRILTSTSTNEFEELIVSLNGVAQIVDRDYDHDGLENWQEYMTGAMRCWRYDDPITPWTPFPEDWYFNAIGVFHVSEEAVKASGCKSEDEFLYKTFFDSHSPLYNPHLVTETSPASQYFSRVTNGWDLAFSSEGSYYLMPTFNGIDYGEHWGYLSGPSGYICTSPLKADTDQDGMDDGYELFHGMNPLLGASGVLSRTGHPCDIVYDRWYDGILSPCGSAESNVWRDPGKEGYDFVKFPWLNGTAAADPDGDDIRNQDEAIMPLVAPAATWYHTDPTPLWMTDSSYSNSIVRKYYRMPASIHAPIELPEELAYGEKTFSMYNVDGYSGGALHSFMPDYWKVYDGGYMNWMFSFEENEGYDTDHDAGSDYEELQGKYRGKTDPQDADSPRRRQAMYFPGPSNPSALQTMPFVSEFYPRAALGWPDDMSFLQYSVECWVRPESAADATVLERAVYTGPSHLTDEQYLRCNFRLAIKNGKWYTMFDPNGTLAAAQVEVQSNAAVKPGEWTYLAATYDAERLTLYVNGVAVGYVLSSLKPAYGGAYVVTYPGERIEADTNGVVTASGSVVETLVAASHTYWFTGWYSQEAFLFGASFKNETDLGYSTASHLNVLNARGWNYYKSFYTGYIDEVRVWDGAIDPDTVADHYEHRKRFTREDALENRSAFYKQWRMGRRRYAKDESGRDYEVMPELRFHWAFDSVPGAENPASVLTAPGGFFNGAKAPYGGPAGYQIPWWKTVVEGNESYDGYGSVYAGLLNWVTWIPNTVTHLPRFDGSTLDSSYWAEDLAGTTPGTYRFARTAEPVSFWTQYTRNGTETDAEFRTTGRRFWQMHVTGTNTASDASNLFDFTGRHLNQVGDDLLPLGGAFVKYVDKMWDEQGASSLWERTGVDVDNDGLPDWWQEYADQNYREGIDPEKPIVWDTEIYYDVGGVKRLIPAYEAYQRDLAKGMYVDANGQVRHGPTQYEQTAKSDGLIPDWWKTFSKIEGADPFDDPDHDGLNNFVEYVASELLPFRLALDPLNATSTPGLLDYFVKPYGGASKLYLGEMLTDHDQMEDHWERSLANTAVANASLWDALKDGDEDGWNNFAENRYNGYMMSTLAQLVSHAVGSDEVLDAPIPTLRLKVRYAGSHFSGGTAADGGASSNVVPNLIVRAFTRDPATGAYAHQRDAQWTVEPGKSVSGAVYLGGWENRVVRGTMTPGNIDLGSVDLEFAQVPQSDLYSWTDENGLHVSMTYAEFRAALEKNPGIIQNIQDFSWLHLAAPYNDYTAADKAVTVTRDSLLQTGNIAVYGERVGTIDLTTGDFEFDLAAMNTLSPNYTFGGNGPASAWGYKEAIFRLTYKANVPSIQTKVYDISLAKPDIGFVRSGLNMIEAFYDNDSNGEYTPGEPLGVLTDVDVGWAGRNLEIELSDMSAIVPRVDLWADQSDRQDRVGTEAFTDGSNRFEVTTAPAPKSRVRIVRYMVDGRPVYRIGVNAGVVLDRVFEQDEKTYLQEGEFLQNGAMDIDWNDLYGDVASWWGTQAAGCKVTNVTYLVVFNWDAGEYKSDSDTSSAVKALSTLVTRRFETDRTIPTACSESAVCYFAQPTFAWKIENEDTWASWFGTTYTAFKVRVKDLAGNLVYDSGIRRLPAKDTSGIYHWTAPLYVGSAAPGTDVMFKNLESYTWEVAVYNAKFSTDDLLSVSNNRLNTGNAFSKPVTFRMNVTASDASSQRLAVRVCYTGPAANLLDKVRVQAYKSPDFTGDPVAEVTVRYLAETTVGATNVVDSLSPVGTDANVELFGLPTGSYFLRAYIDTNGNNVRDDWESWGYLNERDRASKPGIFNPVTLSTAFNPSTSGVRKIYMEDCDTNGNWFPDVWEAEQNGNVFDRAKFAPITGDAEMLGVNPELKRVLNLSDFPMLESLCSKSGLALLSGLEPTKVRVIEKSDGTLGILVENKVETVKVTAMDFDAAGNLEIKVAAAVAPVGLDADMLKLFNARVETTKTVTCTVYRRASLAAKDGWTKAGSAVITVGADEPASVPVTGGKAGQGFYKVEIKD